MSGIIALVVSAFLVMAVFGFALARTKRRSGPKNNWQNEAYLARQEGGSWVENDCGIGREDAAPQSYFPGVR